MSSKSGVLLKFISSIRYAINGLRVMIQYELNARIHFSVFILVTIFGLIMQISTLEWVCIFLAVGFVISMEILNTAIEHLSDYVSPHKNYKIKIIKDLSAGGVLISAITASVVGCLIFLPKIIHLCLKY